MKYSLLLAVILALGAIGWMASGQLADGGNAPVVLKPPARLDSEAQMPLVRVRSQRAEMRQADVTLSGRTAADRTVDIQAETKGRVIEVLVNRGQRVAAGDVIVRLAEEDRPARLKQAKALLKQRQLEHEAAKKLSEKGFRAETQLAGSEADLEAARSAVHRAQIDLENIVIKAPFDGIVEERTVEIGDLAEIGDSIARVVDLDPILVVAYVSEREIGHLNTGDQAHARLITGAEVDGEVSFISAIADPVTRTFRVEVEIPNPEARVPDGVTAEVHIPLEAQPAHLVSPAILTLTDEGVVGVKTVETDGTVGFHPVAILGTDSQGVWLGGLPPQVTFVTVGQEFVNVGQKVKAIPESDLTEVPALGESS